MAWSLLAEPLRFLSPRRLARRQRRVVRLRVHGFHCFHGVDCGLSLPPGSRRLADLALQGHDFVEQIFEFELLGGFVARLNRRARVGGRPRSARRA